MSKHYAVAAIVALVLLAGCQQESKSGDTIAKPTPSPTPSEVPKLGLPDGMPELGLAAEVAPTTGDKDVGVIEVTKKTIWVNLNCIGEGKVVIHVAGNSMDIPCHAGKILPTRNKLSLALPKKVPIKVKAPDAVQWSLRVQQ